MESLRETWAEVDLAALKRNYLKIKALTKAEMMPIVKADAYGHGVIPVVRTLRGCGAHRFGVATLEEALELRKEFPEIFILVLGTVPIACSPILVREKITPTIYRYEQAKALSEAAGLQDTQARLHLKVDTGMGRIGFRPEERDEVLRIATLPHLVIEGIYTHLAAADSADRSFTLEQGLKFSQFCDGLRSKGLIIPLRHAANSAGVMNFPEYHFDLVRPGIILYGLPPHARMGPDLGLEPVLAWKAKVTNLKTINAGETVSYGCTFKAAYPTKVATVPVGYADGLRRNLSNCGEVLLHGKRSTIIGRVCMDQTMLEVTSIAKAAVGDTVTLLGKDGKERIDATEMAGWLGTINYEIVCGISQRVPRIYK